MITACKTLNFHFFNKRVSDITKTIVFIAFLRARKFIKTFFCQPQVEFRTWWFLSARRILDFHFFNKRVADMTETIVFIASLRARKFIKTCFFLPTTPRISYLLVVICLSKKCDDVTTSIVISVPSCQLEKSFKIYVTKYKKNFGFPYLYFWLNNKFGYATMSTVF